MASLTESQSSSSVAPSSDIDVGLFARRPFAVGEDVLVFDDATVVPERTSQTLEVAQDQHVYSARIALVGHSCDPTLRVDPERLVMVALKPIGAGERLTRFVPETEWELVKPFACNCGAENCLGRIAGAVDLAGEQRRGHRFSPHIQERYAERDRPAA